MECYVSPAVHCHKNSASCKPDNKALPSLNPIRFWKIQLRVSAVMGEMRLQALVLCHTYRKLHPEDIIFRTPDRVFYDNSKKPFNN